MTDPSKKLPQGQDMRQTDSPQRSGGAGRHDRVVILENPISGPKKQGGKTPTHDPNKPESYVLSEKTIPSVTDFFENFDEFENKYDQFSGILYTLIASVLIGILVSVREEILYRLPSIEIIFSIVLVSLLLNYFLLNGALYKPFIENEESSMNAKACGFLTILAIVFFYYSLNYLNFYPAAMLLYFGFILVMYIERFYSSIMYTLKELSLATLAFAGALMVISVSFDNNTYENTISTTPTFNGTNSTNITANATQSLIPADGNIEPKSPVVGFVLSGAAGVLIAFVFLLMHTLKEENKTTISYIYTLIITLFLPMFFPIQGVLTPTIVEAGWLLLSGVLGGLTLLILIRALQIERTGKVGVLFLTHLLWLYAIRIIFGNGLQTTGITGCILILVSSVYFCKEGRAIIQARKSFLEDEYKLRHVELRLLH